MLVDCGALGACLTAVTGRSPLVLGKPDPGILCTRHGLEPCELAIVGDRIYTDVAMAQRAGAIAVLVFSGEATAAEAVVMTMPADFVVADVGELCRRMTAVQRGTWCHSGPVSQLSYDENY